jgi:hypothetical protein
MLETLKEEDCIWDDVNTMLLNENSCKNKKVIIPKPWK